MSELHKVKAPLFQVEGVDVVFLTDYRIPSTKRHEDLFYYDIRHADGDWYDPATIQKSVWVNFLGTIATNVPIEKLEADYYNYIVIEDKSKLHKEMLNALWSQ